MVISYWVCCAELLLNVLQPRCFVIITTLLRPDSTPKGSTFSKFGKFCFTSCFSIQRFVKQLLVSSKQLILFQLLVSLVILSLLLSLSLLLLSIIIILEERAEVLPRAKRVYNFVAREDRKRSAISFGHKFFYRFRIRSCLATSHKQIFRTPFSMMSSCILVFQATRPPTRAHFIHPLLIYCTLANRLAKRKVFLRQITAGCKHNSARLDKWLEIVAVDDWNVFSFKLFKRCRDLVFLHVENDQDGGNGIFINGCEEYCRVGWWWSKKSTHIF